MILRLKDTRWQPRRLTNTRISCTFLYAKHVMADLTVVCQKLLICPFLLQLYHSCVNVLSICKIFLHMSSISMAEAAVNVLNEWSLRLNLVKISDNKAFVGSRASLTSSARVGCFSLSDQIADRLIDFPQMTPFLFASHLHTVI